MCRKNRADQAVPILCIHILISEPKRKTIPIVMQVLKQRVALRLLRRRRSSSQREIWEAIRQHFWQPRSYDFNVYSDRKVTEKLLTCIETRCGED